ncbi:MAG: penicillin-binding protein activator [Myxococcales bacterium]|nr:penicillin-binding protein activator [Myxococcales bacterium]
MVGMLLAASAACAATPSHQGWQRPPGASTRGTTSATATVVSTPASSASEPAASAARGAPLRRGVAVLLPLSGRYRDLGLEVKQAIGAAAQAAAVGPVFTFFDTAGTPEGAAVAVRAARAEGFAFLLGPIGQRETAAAIEAVAGQAVIAHLSPLAPASPGAHVFRFAAGPQDESAWAFAVAADQQFPTMAVFYPDDDTGRLAAAALLEVARADVALEVEVVAAVPFAPAAATLSDDVRVLLGMVPATNSELRRHLSRHRKQGYKTFTPRPGFSLLYVPASYELGALVASYLPHYNVELRTPYTADTFALQRKYRGNIPEVVQLVGSGNWAGEAFISRAGQAAEGALILAACPGEFLAGSESERIQRLLQDALRRRPSELAMQAYDAATAAASVVVAMSRQATAGPAEATAAWPGATLAALSQAVHAVVLADGACGNLSLSPHGTIVREPTLLTVRDGVIEVASW